MKATPLTWDTLDWSALDRLRDRFLAGGQGGGSYWTSRSDLENYHLTFAQRIGWKWDAVLREMKLRGWTPPSDALIDWGCGSGIAGRRVVECFGADKFKSLRVVDQSALAMQFAAEQMQSEFPLLQVVIGEAAAGPASRSVAIGTTDAGAEDVGFGSRDTPGVTVIISHVLNELTEAGGRTLRQVIDGAAAILWVEPGTYADSRALIAMREELREQFHVIAPCTHQAGCGLLATENERHWCHHFASPPTGIMADSNWVRFAQRAGIDLRSLPYSFLVLERKSLRDPVPGLLPDGYSRIIGEPRRYKGFAKIFSCQADGARELMLQKRDFPELFKALKNAEAEPVHRWVIEGARIEAPRPP